MAGGSPERFAGPAAAGSRGPVPRRRGEEGSQVVEFLGLLPVLLLVTAVAWQFILAAYAVVVAESAVRDAARVAAVAPEADVELAARRALVAAAGSLRVQDVEVRLRRSPPSRGMPGLVSREVEVRARFAVPLVRLGPSGRQLLPVTVERRVVMPWEGGA